MTAQLIQFPSRPTAREGSRRPLVDRIEGYVMKREEIQSHAGTSIPVCHLTPGVFAVLDSVAVDAKTWSEANAAGTGTPTP